MYFALKPSTRSLHVVWLLTLLLLSLILPLKNSSVRLHIYIQQDTFTKGPFIKALKKGFLECSRGGSPALLGIEIKYSSIHSLVLTSDANGNLMTDAEKGFREEDFFKNVYTHTIIYAFIYYTYIYMADILFYLFYSYFIP